MYVRTHQTKKQINWPTHFMVHLHSWAGDGYTFDYGLSCWHGNPIQFTSPFAYLGLRMNNSSNRPNWRRYELNWTLYAQFIFSECRKFFTLMLLNSVNFEISRYRVQIKLILITKLTLRRRNYFFLILPHPVYRMWIIQEPNKLALWNKLHFEEKKNGEHKACLKYPVPIFVE